MSETTPYVLSVQSHVAYGHAGNAAAVFPLQRLGVEVLPVHTVQFSNHTGYGAFRGQVFEAAHLEEIFLGLEERGILPQISAVLSGYMGDASIGDAILRIAGKIRSLNPHAIYVCDPVFGDVGRGVFVRPDIPGYYRDHALAAADITTPNQFEFEMLTGSTLDSLEMALRVAREHIGQTEKTVIITSLMTADIPASELATLAVTAQHAWLVRTPVISKEPLPNGMGDAFTAILLGRLLQGKALAQAMQLATASLYALVDATPAGSRDLPIIAAQREIVTPAAEFTLLELD